MLKGVYLLNRVCNFTMCMGGLFFICVTSRLCLGLVSIVIVKQVLSSLNYVTLLKQLFKP